jgi:hypothetical protein
MGVCAADAPPHRLSLDDVYAMVGAGIVDETERVELEGGALVDMVPPGEGHEGFIEWLPRHFVKAAGNGVRVRISRDVPVFSASRCARREPAGTSATFRFRVTRRTE